MLRHAIAPSARFTKASHDVVRHSRLGSDAKILLLYVQGLPDDATYKPLSELARKLGIKGRAYQKAKEQLVEHGYVHEWRSQGDGGRWLTEQLVANNPLTSEQARHLRGTPPPPAPKPALAPVLSPAPAIGPPSTHFPTVGEPAPRTVGGYKPAEDHGDKTTPHPPPNPSKHPAPPRNGHPNRPHHLQLHLRQPHSPPNSPQRNGSCSPCATPAANSTWAYAKPAPSPWRPSNGWSAA